ncbi:hypothetical protein GCM10023226_40750 [Nocardioides nanhaiensis]|uniref:Helix-turn-helix domain-containing protein n=2 Tax=Nocardioides nanhaiensis TaxID=1476871 RepID=A0ABP8X1B2_9ACTN
MNAAQRPPDPTWISYVAAADLAGVSHTTILNAIRRGELGHRPTIGRRLSVNRASVVEWTAGRARAAEDAAERARERALAHADTLPPASDHDWLTGPQAAEVLGVTKKRVSQLVQADLLPHVRKGRRTWFGTSDATSSRLSRPRAASGFTGMISPEAIRVPLGSPRTVQSA